MTGVTADRTLVSWRRQNARGVKLNTGSAAHPTAQSNPTTVELTIDFRELTSNSFVFTFSVEYIERLRNGKI
jgi:hypothetical protein